MFQAMFLTSKMSPILLILQGNVVTSLTQRNAMITSTDSTEGYTSILCEVYYFYFPVPAPDFPATVPLCSAHCPTCSGTRRSCAPWPRARPSSRWSTLGEHTVDYSNPRVAYRIPSICYRTPNVDYSNPRVSFCGHGTFRNPRKGTFCNLDKFSTLCMFLTISILIRSSGIFEGFYSRDPKRVIT